MSNVISIKDEIAKQDKASLALEKLAIDWSKETNIDAFISNFTECEKTHAKVKDMMLMAHEEGLYRGYIQGVKK